MSTTPPPGSGAPTGPLPPPPMPGEPATLPQMVGQRVEGAVDFGRRAGWTVQVNPVDPVLEEQPDGLVIAQKPDAGLTLGPGSVVLLEVVRRRSWFERNQTAVATAFAGLFAVLALVFGIVALTRDGGGDDDLQAELDDANERIATLEEQLELASGDESETVAVLQQQVQELDAQVQDLEAALEAANTAAQQTQDQLEAAEAALEEVAAERDAATEARDEAIAERDAAVAARDQAVAERDAALQQVAELQAQLGGIEASVTAMPSFVGQQQVAVQDFADSINAELIVEEVDTAPAAAATGTVLEQLPAPGVPLVDGSVLWVQVYVPAP